MEKLKTFEDIAEKNEIFEPKYTKEFIEYMEKSIFQSKKNEEKAIDSANKIIILR